MGVSEHKAERGKMAALHSVFIVLYAWMPFLVVPFLAYYYDNWWLLFGILFSYLGASPLIVFVFTALIIGFWIKSGFDLRQYITFYYLASLWGCLMFRLARAYDEERQKGMSDEERLKNDPAYRSSYNVGYAVSFTSVFSSPLSEQLKALAMQYVKDNPDAVLTSDIMEELATGIEK